MNRPCCHVLKTTISFSKRNLSHFERVTTHYQTLQTLLGLNVTRYHKLNALPQALPHVVPYIFFEICLVLGYLQRVTTRYHHFLKDIKMYFLINLPVMRGSALQIAQNHATLGENVRQCVR